MVVRHIGGGWHWFDLFRYVVTRDRFLFIVLDDARYDAFSALYKRYVNGYLMKVRVPPPNTYGWLPKVFSMPEFKRVRVFYAKL